MNWLRENWVNYKTLAGVLLVIAIFAVTWVAVQYQKNGQKPIQHRYLQEGYLL